MRCFFLLLLRLGYISGWDKNRREKREIAMMWKEVCSSSLPLLMLPLLPPSLLCSSQYVLNSLHSSGRLSTYNSLYLTIEGSTCSLKDAFSTYNAQKNRILLSFYDVYSPFVQKADNKLNADPLCHCIVALLPNIFIIYKSHTRAKR